MKPFGFHEGDRSEYLAHYALSAIGHCVPVPRQADYFGVDLFLQLHEPKGRNLHTTGLGCAFQLKSTTDDIPIDTEEKRITLHGLAYPFFIGVLMKSEGRLDIYKTIYRSAVYWHFPTANFTIRLDGSEYLDHPNSTKHNQVLACGRPIASVTISELDGANRQQVRSNLRDVLSYWTCLDTDALAWKANYLPMVPFVGHYETNKRPTDIPAILTLTQKEHIQNMVRSLDNSLFGVYTCCDKLAACVDEIPESERQSLRSLADRSLSLAHTIDPFGDSLPEPGDTHPRMIYRID